MPISKKKKCVILAVFAVGSMLFSHILMGSDDIPESDDPLRKSAGAGDAAAQFKLGNEYFYGGPRKRNYTLAAHWFRKAAETGLPEAQFNYALCLDSGLGVKKDPLEAFGWYKKSAEAGFKYARFNYAMIIMYGMKGDTERAIEDIPPRPAEATLILEELAAEHFQPAEVELARIMLEDKDQTPAKMRRAFDILKRLAEQKEPLPAAIRMLADCYYGGIGCEPDSAEMIRLLTKASDLGDPESKAKLAFCYVYGRGVETDTKKALSLFREAAAAGLPMAQFKYGEMIEEGNEPGLGLADAIKWYEKSAAGSCSQALFKLGVMKYEGIGFEKSMKDAAECFFKAAKLGYPRAQYNLACMFLDGAGNSLAKDESAAFYWFTQAAVRGDANAQRRLAVCFFEGIGTDRSYSKGMEWLRKAAKNGDPIAIRMLRDSSRSAW